ncbi:METTL17 family protein [Megaselia abdita]
MMNFRKVHSFRSLVTVPYRQTSKIAVTVDPEVLRKLETEEMKPRAHPGVCRTGNIVVPPRIVKAIFQSIKDHPIKSLLQSAKDLNQYTAARHPPPEPNELRKKIKEIEKEVDKKFLPPEDLNLLTEKELEKYKSLRSQRVEKILKQRTFAWKPLSFKTDFEALTYAIGRFSKEYAVLSKIFKEISQRDPDFKPRSFLDFGSGVGSGMWAASSVWNDAIFEFLNVDSSREMNDLSELILRDGNENKQTVMKNVFYRQFLPASDTKYQFLLSAFTLFELNNRQSRKEVLLNLWKKCDGYLVLVEEGTFAGFRLINEAREFLLSLGDGEVFAPCPHDNKCPRTAKMTDKLPCNFQIFYQPLGIGEKVTEHKGVRYSYLVLKKGIVANEERWPRLVEPTLVRSKHTICRMCTAKGNLQEIIFTQSKHGKFAFRCAKSSTWGDRLPIEVGDEIVEEKKEVPKKVFVENVDIDPSRVVK